MYFLRDQLQTWCESSTWSTTQLISFGGRMAVIFMENYQPQGQTLKSMEPYHVHVVPHMKALNECFPDQLRF
jgi:hypothetical protein